MIFSSPFFLQGKDLKESYQYILSFTPSMVRDTEMMSSISKTDSKKVWKYYEWNSSTKGQKPKPVETQC